MIYLLNRKVAVRRPENMFSYSDLLNIILFKYFGKFDEQRKEKLPIPEAKQIWRFLLFLVLVLLVLPLLVLLVLVLLLLLLLLPLLLPASDAHMQSTCFTIDMELKKAVTNKMVSYSYCSQPILTDI